MSDNEQNPNENFNLSTKWGIFFIVLFLAVIAIAIYSVMTGNYNTP